MKFWLGYICWTVAFACVLVYLVCGFCVGGGVDMLWRGWGNHDYLIIFMGLVRLTVGTLFTGGILLAICVLGMYFLDDENKGVA